MENEVQKKVNKNLILGAAAGAGLLAAALLFRRTTYTFKDKVVLITGGSRGLGLILAKQLGEEGAKIAICARDAGELAKAEEMIRQTGAEVLAIPCDLTNEADIKLMFKDIYEKYKQIDVLINNAGIIQAGPQETMELSDFEEAMKIHFYAPLHTTLQVLPEMIKRKEGKIVNIISFAGKVPVPHLLPYTASKFAFAGFSEGLTTEIGKHNIDITSVFPGLMRTGSHQNAIVKGKKKEEYAVFSITDAMPMISMGAERAARKIINACRRGDKELILSIPAKLMTVLHGVLPEQSLNLFSLVNDLLPGVGENGKEAAKGYESYSWASPSLLTANIDKASEKYNEV